MSQQGDDARGQKGGTERERALEDDEVRAVGESKEKTQEG